MGEAPHCSSGQVGHCHDQQIVTQVQQPLWDEALPRCRGLCEGVVRRGAQGVVVVVVVVVRVGVGRERSEARGGALGGGVGVGVVRVGVVRRGAQGGRGGGRR